VTHYEGDNLYHLRITAGLLKAHSVLPPPPSLAAKIAVASMNKFSLMVGTAYVLFVLSIQLNLLTFSLK
jgi:hypothetical protein